MRTPHTRRRGAGRTLVGVLAAVAIALLTAGCASETPAQIGIRAVPVAAPTAGLSSDAVVAAILGRLEEQLKEADATNDGKLAKLTPQSQQFLALLPVLVAERIGGLDRLGTALIDKRLTAVFKLRAEIVALQKLTAGQKASILGQLDHVSSGLGSLRVAILADTLPDVLRNDVRKVAGFHVFGFVVPLAHMIAAADELVTAAGTLSSAAGVLQTRLSQNSARLVNPAHDQALLADLLAQTSNGRQQATATLASLGGLSVSGYPGNHPLLVSGRAALQSSRVAMAAARNDVDLILADLGG